MKFPLLFSPEEQKILKSIYGVSRRNKVKLYLVGGVLRDMLLKRKKENPDFDFCLKKHAISFARRLARKIKAGFVILDRQHGACRLVKKIKDKVYTFDFTDFRGKTLEDDLLHRDFTINTLALELEGALLKNRDLTDLVIDFYGAKKDLKAKVISSVSKNSFAEDPLRILRAFSFSAILGFKIDETTKKMLKLRKRKLAEVSFERIRDELFKIFTHHFCIEYLKQLDNLGIIEIIFPEIKKMRNIGQGPYHHLDVWQHTLETIRQLELIFKEIKYDRRIESYLGQVVSGGRSRRQLLKLAALLHDIGKPAAMRREAGKIKFYGHERIGVAISLDIAKRLKLSNDEWESLKRIIQCHLRPGFLADTDEVTPRAIFRYFRDTKIDALSVLLISLADQRATKGPQATRESRFRHERLVAALIKKYFKKQEEKKPVRLVNGNELMRKFKLGPSPLIGKILLELEELQAIGKLKNKSQAFKVSAQMIKEEGLKK
ncbi:HD domain-containing protein [bacterium]|nr:MAG: HD domain-containing protein [bacterium]